MDLMDNIGTANRLSNLSTILLSFVVLLAGVTEADISCNRTTLSQCLATIEPLLDNPALARGIPSTEEAVQARCKMFKTGMACVDEYKDKCLPIRQRQAIERGVAGAKYTFAFLCDDPVFQSEFLKHHGCFRAASTDWEQCANHFQNMVAEEISAVNVSRTDRNLGLCCAKHGFLRCVYYSAQFKCRKDAALFLMKVAQTLTDTQVHEDACRRIKFDEVCTRSGIAPPLHPPGSTVPLLLALAIGCLFVVRR